MIVETLGEWHIGELVAVKDGAEWTFGISDVHAGRRVAFVDDRPIVARESAIVLRSGFRKQAGVLVGRRFKSRDSAREALAEFRIQKKGL